MPRTLYARRFTWIRCEALAQHATRLERNAIRRRSIQGTSRSSNICSELVGALAGSGTRSVSRRTQQIGIELGELGS